MSLTNALWWPGGLGVHRKRFARSRSAAEAGVEVEVGGAGTKMVQRFSRHFIRFVAK